MSKNAELTKELAWALKNSSNKAAKEVKISKKKKPIK